MPIKLALRALYFFHGLTPSLYFYHLTLPRSEIGYILNGREICKDVLKT